MANDAHEEFWGCTLTKKQKEFLWNPTETEDDVEHKLQVTSACLGHNAKEGERNLIELTTEDDDGRKITCSMVSLRAGGKECLHLELGFNNPTKFTLKEGNGPISLCGVHLKAVPIDFDEDESESDDEDIPNLVEPKIKEVETKEGTKAVKRPLEENKDKKKEGEKPSKKKKPDPQPQPESEDDEEEEGGEDDDEEDEDEDDEEMPSLLDGEAEEDDDEESEDEDEPEEGDDVESDDEAEDDEEDEDEEDEEEDEDEDETPVKPVKKITNGHSAKAQKLKQEQKKPEKTPQKTPGKKTTQATPKSAAGAKKTPEEIKAMLLKSPNLPKKFDKFSNYMKNNLKVTDEKSQKEFWDYIQKNKK